MEESHFTEVPTAKIYSEKAIAFGAFLGTPLVAGYFMVENFKAFNESEKIKKTWIITITVTIAILLIIFLIPEDIEIPNMVFSAIYAASSYSIGKYFQEQKIREHIEEGGQLFNWWRVVGIGLIGSLVLFTVILGIAFAQGA